MDRIISISLSDKRAGDGYSLSAVVRGVTASGVSVKRVVDLGTCPGAASYSKVKVLDRGRVAIFWRHMMARYNFVTELFIRNHHVESEEECSESLFLQLPKNLQSRSLDNNVMLEKVKGNDVTLNYWTRDERDGVKATFRVSNRKWKCVGAKYWRDKRWNGVRNFGP